MVGFTPQRPLSCGIHALQGCLLVALSQGNARECFRLMKSWQSSPERNSHCIIRLTKVISLSFQWPSVTESHWMVYYPTAAALSRNPRAGRMVSFLWPSVRETHKNVVDLLKFFSTLSISSLSLICLFYFVLYIKMFIDEAAYAEYCTLFLYAHSS
jgi:hypothetical protein